MGKGRMPNENEKEIKFRICNSGGRILYFMDMELTDEEQVRMICQLNQWYSDTDQDVEGFVEEFLLVCNRNHGRYDSPESKISSFRRGHGAVLAVDAGNKT